jgi:hypothetical protein
MKRFYPVVAALAVVLITGVVHGLWTDRWAPEHGPVHDAAARLDQLPMTLGDWEGQTVEIDPRDLESISGYLCRRYVNRRDHHEVSVFLVCGRPGPVAIHTPDLCYQASGYEVGPRATYTREPGADSPAAAFFTAQCRKVKATEQTRLRIFWSWYAGGTWQVADNPRLTFARHPVLYKLYLVHKTYTANEAFAEDPCTDLMKQLLPELERSVFAGT